MNLKNLYFKIIIYFFKWVSLLVNIIYIWCAFFGCFYPVLNLKLKGGGDFSSLSSPPQQVVITKLIESIRELKRKYRR